MNKQRLLHRCLHTFPVARLICSRSSGFLLYKMCIRDRYVSVTIPVKEGYKYSIEHLLDNGATETIIPSVNGSTMVFSTHSFSPFGIAGFRPIVGEDIANGAYGDGSTPTPTPVSYTHLDVYKRQSWHLCRNMYIKCNCPHP